MWAFFSSSKSGEEDGDETENNDLAMLEGGQADTPASLKAFPAYKPPASLKTGRVRGIGGGIPSLPAAAPPPAPRGVLSSAEIELREKLRDTEAASAHLKKNLEEIELRCVSLNEQVEGLKLAKIVDESEREKADQRLRDTTQVSTDLQQQRDSLTAEMASLERDLEQQRGRSARWTRECEAVAGDLLETEMLTEALAADRDDLSALCDELTARAASAEESLAASDEAVRGLRAALADERSARESERRELQESLALQGSQHERTLQTGQAQLLQTEERTKVLEETLRVSEARCAHLLAVAEAARALAEGLQDEGAVREEQTSVQVAAARAARAVAEESFEAAQRETKELRLSVAKLETTKQTACGVIEALKQQRKQMENQASAANEDLEHRLEEAIAAGSAAADELAATQNRLAQVHAALEENKRGHCKEIEDLRREVETAKQIACGDAEKSIEEVAAASAEKEKQARDAMFKSSADLRTAVMAKGELARALEELKTKAREDQEEAERQAEERLVVVSGELEAVTAEAASIREALAVAQAEVAAVQAALAVETQKRRAFEEKSAAAEAAASVAAEAAAADRDALNRQAAFLREKLQACEIELQISHQFSDAAEREAAELSYMILSAQAAEHEATTELEEMTNAHDCAMDDCARLEAQTSEALVVGEELREEIEQLRAKLRDQAAAAEAAREENAATTAELKATTQKLEASSAAASAASDAAAAAAAGLLLEREQDEQEKAALQFEHSAELATAVEVVRQEKASAIAEIIAKFEQKLEEATVEHKETLKAAKEAAAEEVAKAEAAAAEVKSALEARAEAVQRESSAMLNALRASHKEALKAAKEAAAEEVAKAEAATAEVKSVEARAEAARRESSETLGALRASLRDVEAQRDGVAGALERLEGRLNDAVTAKAAAEAEADAARSEAAAAAASKQDAETRATAMADAAAAAVAAAAMAEAEAKTAKTKPAAETTVVSAASTRRRSVVTSRCRNSGGSCSSSSEGAPVQSNLKQRIQLLNSLKTEVCSLKQENTTMAAELNKCLDALKAAGLDVPSSAASRKKSSAVQKGKGSSVGGRSGSGTTSKENNGAPAQQVTARSGRLAARKPLAAK